MRTLRQSDRRQIQQPRRDDTPAPPNLSNVCDVEIVLEMFGAAKRSRLCVRGSLNVTNVRMMQHVQPFGVRSHQTILDAVVNHLHKVPRSGGTTMQVASAAVPESAARPGVGDTASRPGASVLKIGSRC